MLVFITLWGLLAPCGSTGSSGLQFWCWARSSIRQSPCWQLCEKLFVRPRARWTRKVLCAAAIAVVASTPMGLRGVLSMSLEMCFSLTPRVYPEACSTPDVLPRLLTSLTDSVRAPSDEGHAGTVVLMLLKNLLTPANGPGVCGCQGLGMAACVCWQPALPAGGNARVPPCVLMQAWRGPPPSGP